MEGNNFFRNDEDFDEAEFALPEFLVPRRGRQHSSRVPAVALLSGPPRWVVSVASYQSRFGIPFGQILPIPNTNEADDYLVDLSGKTSLLLQLAYNLAVDVLARDRFVLTKNAAGSGINEGIEVIYEVLDTASEVFERVYIKYIKNDEDLRKYFAAFHLYPNLPTAVIVDDFVDFFGDSFGHRQGGFKMQASRDGKLVKTLSLCQNAIGYANEKAGTGIKCRLIMSDSHPRDGPRLLYIFKRWISQIYVIKGLKASSRFVLGLQHIGTGRMGNIVGRFTLVNLSLSFDGLEAREE